MENTGAAATNGVTNFLGLLTIAFIVLKLTEVISWSWWWVLSPLWIPISLVLIVIILIWVFNFY